MLPLQTTTDFYCYVYPIKFTVLKIFTSTALFIYKTYVRIKRVDQTISKQFFFMLWYIKVCVFHFQFVVIINVDLNTVVKTQFTWRIMREIQYTIINYQIWNYSWVSITRTRARGTQICSRWENFELWSKVYKALLTGGTRKNLFELGRRSSCRCSS